MTVVIREIGREEYARYGEVDPGYEVRSILRVVPVERGLSGLRLVEEPVAQPYTKTADDPYLSLIHI